MASSLSLNVDRTTRLAETDILGHRYKMSNTRLLNRTSLFSVNNFRSHGKKIYIDPYLNRREVKYFYGKLRIIPARNFSGNKCI